MAIDFRTMARSAHSSNGGGLTKLTEQAEKAYSKVELPETLDDSTVRDAAASHSLHVSPKRRENTLAAD